MCFGESLKERVYEGSASSDFFLSFEWPIQFLKGIFLKKVVVFVRRIPSGQGLDRKRGFLWR